MMPPVYSEIMPPIIPGWSRPPEGRVFDGCDLGRL